jgi:Tfp pilus assembly PilM family ATPase
MARLLALEWDGNEARVALARTRGTTVLLEHAFHIPLAPRDAGVKIDASAVGKQFAEELAKRGWSKGEALVAVGRSSSEMRFLTTPPAPPEEVPDLVRFQAMRQFTTLGDEWPLDFVTLGTQADGGLNVLAAAISSDLVSQMQAICAAANLECKRLVLRPFAAASLIKERAADGRCRMLVDVLSSDVDLTVLVGPQVMFPRTAKLPTGDDEVVSRALVGEVRRTIIAAQNQLGGRRVEQVIILGDGHHQVALRSLLQQELQLEAEVLNPLSFVELTDEARGDQPVMAGAFAPLMGMLKDEATEQAPAIDFLHPRRRPEPPNHRRLYSWAGGVAAAVALVLFALVWMQLSSLDSKISELQQELNKQTKLAKDGKPVRDEVQRLDQFAAADVFWLDELRELSEEFPSAEKARVDEFYAASKGNDDPATLSLQGGASEATVIAQIESALRDERHVVTGSGGREDERATAMRWRFKEDIHISPNLEEPEAAPSAADTKANPATKVAPAARAGK